MFFYFYIVDGCSPFSFSLSHSVSQAVLYFVVTENNLEVGGIR